MPTELRPPQCPACGRLMTLVRRIDKEPADLTLNVFECVGCRVSYMVAVKDQDDGAA